MTSRAAPGYPGLVDRVRAAQLPTPAERREIRHRSRVSLAAIAAEIKVNPMTVLRWERGESEPRFDHAVAYGRVLEALRTATATAA